MLVANDLELYNFFIKSGTGHPDTMAAALELAHRVKDLLDDKQALIDQLNALGHREKLKPRQKTYYTATIHRIYV